MKIVVTFLFSLIVGNSFAQQMIKAVGYTQRGKASYYPDNRVGTTSSGEPYDMNSMTAGALNIAPGAYIAITNLDNGKEIVVKVNDRVYSNERIIDLTKTAADRLGMIGKTVSDVKVEILYFDEKNQLKNYKIASRKDLAIATEDMNAKPTVEQIPLETKVQNNNKDTRFAQIGTYTLDGKIARPQGYTLQLGVYSQVENALAKAEMFAKTEKVYIQNDGQMIRLLINQYGSKEEAVSKQQLLLKQKTQSLVRMHLAETDKK